MVHMHCTRKSLSDTLSVISFIMKRYHNIYKFIFFMVRNIPIFTKYIKLNHETYANSA